MYRNQMLLSPVDHVFLGEGAYPVQFVFYYPERLNVAKLSLGLKRIESLFWPVLRGRLDFDGRFVKCVDSGSAIKISEHFHSSSMPDFDSAEALAPFAIDINLSQELGAISVFHLKTGSLLSVNMAHCLVDGYSFFYLLGFWARASHESLSKRIIAYFLASPKHKRELTSPPINSNFEVPSDVDDWLFHSTGLSYANPRQGFAAENIKWSQFKITKDQIREACDHQFSHPKDLGLSWHDLVSVLVWQKSAELWPQQDRLRLTTAFDFRRVFTQINSRYFGNAVLGAGLEKTLEEVQSQNILELAKSVRRSTINFNATTVEKGLKSLAIMWSKHGNEFSSRCHVSHPDKGLLVTNLTRLPTNQLNFGSGPPSRVVALTPAPRTALITSDAQGDFQVRLSAPLSMS